MLFNLEHDTGARVTGYIVPDAFTAVPKIRIVGGGDELLVIEASEVRAALIASGRHETGRCGFSIDLKLLPHLRDINDLEIFEVETGTLVYRRPQPSVLQRKVVRLESHLFPLWQLDESLRPSFQYFARGIERLGSETVTQMFLLNKIPSVYLSGRIPYRSYAYYIEAGFDTLLLIQDPYDELAERLFVLGNINQLGRQHIGLRDNLGMRAAIEFAEEILGKNVGLDDERHFRRSLKRMPAEVASVLSNPLVRMLTTSSPDEMPRRNAIANALAILASISVLGLRSESELFLKAVAEFLGVDEGLPPPVPKFGKVAVLASTLRNIGDLGGFLETDLELYHSISEAYRKVPPI